MHLLCPSWNVPIETVLFVNTLSAYPRCIYLHCQAKDNFDKTIEIQRYFLYLNLLYPQREMFKNAIIKLLEMNQSKFTRFQSLNKACGSL